MQNFERKFCKSLIINIVNKIVILGGGESGLGAALLAKKLGYDIFVSDKGILKNEHKHIFRTNAIPYEESKHTWERIFEAAEIIKSPGIPDTTPLLRELYQRGIPVISEIEFASRHANATLLGITGSNGKTTTTNLTYHLLKSAGGKVGIGGNVGQSFSRNILELKQDIFVLELSSFQLDGIARFRPDVAILLNITPDHLDRYDYKMEHYIRSKFRIALNQRAEDAFIYNADDNNIQSFLIDNKLISKKIPVKNAFYNKKKLKVGSSLFDMQQCSLKGSHNFFNAACAIHAAKIMGLPDGQIQEGLNTFVNAPHRLERVASRKGVEYINDSKATNVDAVFYALRAMEKPVVWIAGGTDKGNDYRSISSLVEEKVKALICLGMDNAKLREVFSPILKNIEEVQSAREAVKRAAIYAEEGDVVLLSPACASFDLFKNYEDRGNQFKEAVRKLIE